MKRKIGVGLIIASYAILLYIALSAPAYTRAHPNMDATLLTGYGSPWPVALTAALALVGIVLALVPIRRGERWAMATSLATWIILVATRFATDPRCLVVLDPHQHGCHTFMIAAVLGVIGLALAAFG
jgi:hypothetical protein